MSSTKQASRDGATKKNVGCFNFILEFRVYWKNIEAYLSKVTTRFLQEIIQKILYRCGFSQLHQSETAVFSLWTRSCSMVIALSLSLISVCFRLCCSVRLSYILQCYENNKLSPVVPVSIFRVFSWCCIGFRHESVASGP